MLITNPQILIWLHNLKYIKRKNNIADKWAQELDFWQTLPPLELKACVLLV